MSAGRSVGYAMAAGVMGLIGWLIATAAGVDQVDAAGAMAAAWTVQMAAFGVLIRRLAAGRDATPAWLGGIALRGVAVLAAWPLNRLGLLSRPSAIAFGLGLVALIILEAVWLATILPKPGSNVE